MNSILCSAQAKCRTVKVNSGTSRKTWVAERGWVGGKQQGQGLFMLYLQSCLSYNVIAFKADLFVRIYIRSIVMIDNAERQRNVLLHTYYVFSDFEPSFKNVKLELLMLLNGLF